MVVAKITSSLRHNCRTIQDLRAPLTVVLSKTIRNEEINLPHISYLSMAKLGIFVMLLTVQHQGNPCKKCRNSLLPEWVGGSAFFTYSSARILDKQALTVHTVFFLCTTSSSTEFPQLLSRCIFCYRSGLLCSLQHSCQLTKS